MYKSFLGKMDDSQSQGKGIGKKMCCCGKIIARQTHRGGSASESDKGSCQIDNNKQSPIIEN